MEQSEDRRQHGEDWTAQGEGPGGGSGREPERNELERNELEHLAELDQAAELAATEAGAGRPGDPIRQAVAEAASRGAPMVSAGTMQTRLFSVYDTAVAVPEALELVQRQLGLTLGRNWYSPQEVERLADQLEWLLAAGPGEAVGASDAGEPGAGAT